jgi:hypothetical protein
MKMLTPCTNGLAIGHADRTYKPENSQDTPGLNYAFLLVGFNTFLDISVENRVYELG